MLTPVWKDVGFWKMIFYQHCIGREIGIINLLPFLNLLMHNLVFFILMVSLFLMSLLIKVLMLTL